jgi:hypothetical protein
MSYCIGCRLEYNRKFQGDIYETLNQSLVYTPNSRFVVENIILAYLVKKFPAFYGTHRFITVFKKYT